MMEMIFFGIGIILLIASWHFMWLPTMLDATRDKLFDLRDDQLRSHFVQRGIPLDNKLYCELRDLINGHLRNTESLSFFSFVYMVGWAGKRPEIHQMLLKRIDKRFRSDDKELAELASNIRKQAVTIMIEYMVLTSISAFLLTIIAMLAMLVSKFSKAVKQHFNGTEGTGYITWTRFAAALLAVTSLIGGVKSIDASASMEEYALVANV
jgi:hypothetical protein